METPPKGDIEAIIDRLLESPDDIVIERRFGTIGKLLKPQTYKRSEVEAAYDAWRVREMLKRSKTAVGIPVVGKVLKRFVSRDGVEFKPDENG